LCGGPHTISGQAFHFRLPGSFIENFSDRIFRGLKPFGYGTLDLALGGRTGVAN
jgi:hypothetical protein